jgi:hypothetical protein
MEVVLLLFVVFFFTPAVGAIYAFTISRKLRGRVEDLERRELRLAERVLRLEGRGSAPPAPVVASPVPVPVPVAPPPPRPPAPDAWPAPVLPPRILRTAPIVTKTEPAKESEGLETLIGERLLPRLGVIAIVLGLGLLVWYSYTNLGPKGRLALAGTVGVAMVGGGIFLRRGERTGLLGGCLIGGGWAVTYITAYAAGFVPTSRIVDSPQLGFGLLIAVSAAALIHALRYRNETIAGLAYLLTIVTLFLAPEPGPSAWLAIALAATVLVVLAWREKWIRLCTVGAALLYGTEVALLNDTPISSIFPALGLLGTLWILWNLPNYFHRPAGETEKGIHGLLVGINFAGVIITAALIEHWFDYEHTKWVWLTFGGLYGVHATFGRAHAWRPAYVASLAFSAILAAIGAQELLSGLGPAWAWISIAAALFAWGLMTKDAAPRILGMVALAVTFLRFWVVDHQLPGAWAPALAISGVAYGFSATLAYMRGALAAKEAPAAAVLSYLGASALGLVIWNYPPDLMSGGLYALAGAILLVLGRQFGFFVLRMQGVGLLAMAAVCVVTENLVATGVYAGVSLKIVSTVPVLALWLFARLMRLGDDELGKRSREFMGVLLFAGLLALVSVELGAPETPAAWAAICGLWFLWGRQADSRLESALSALGATVTVLLYAAVDPVILPGLALTGPVPTGAWLLGILAAMHLAGQRGAWTRNLVAGAMALAGFALLAKEMSGTWLTLSWAVLGFALAGYGFLVRDRVSRWSSLIVLGICLGKVVLFDLAQFEMPVKIATLITLGSVMVTLSFVYARHHKRIAGYLAAKE